MECQQSNKRWIDPTFKPDDSSLYIDPFNPKPPKDIYNREIPIVWLRPHEYIVGDYYLFKDKVAPGDVKQGALGDCWIMGAFAVVAAREDLLKKLFVSSAFSEFGIYVCQFYKNGWKTVIIDDLIPCNKHTGKPVYGTNTKPNGNFINIFNRHRNLDINYRKSIC